MKKAILFFAIPVFFLSCSQEKTGEQKTEDIRNAFILQEHEVVKTMQLPAELLPYEKAELNAKVEGYVQKLLVDIGDKVRKGELLMILDAPEVKAHYAEANARYQESEADYNASKDKFLRTRNAAVKHGVIAEVEVINVRSQMIADSSAMISARSTAMAYGELQNYLNIRAPFDGRITKRFVDAGDFVGSGNNTSLLTIERADRLRLRVHVPESFVNSVPDADTIIFTTKSAFNKFFTAKLARKSGSIDQDTRTELWEYEYDNRAGELKPGMYATAMLHLVRQEASLVVPHPAVATTLEKKFVIRVKNAKTEWIDVREGISNEKGIEIFGSVNAGDTVLSRGSDEIKPGTPLKVSIQPGENK